MKCIQRRGSLIVEVLVSIGFVALVTVAIASLYVSNVRIIRAAGNQSQATALAKQALEQVYSVKRTDWNSLADLSEGYYTMNIVGGSYTFTPDTNVPAGTVIDGMYRRSLYVSHGRRTTAGILAEDGTVDDPEVRKVTVMVSWKYQQRDMATKLASYFTHWNGNE